MKTLYTFTLPKEIEVENPIESLNEKGEKVTVLKKEKQIVYKKFAIRKPTRELIDSSILFNAALTAEYIRKGCLTKAMLSKRLANDGGILSEEETKEYKQAYTDFFKKGEEMKVISDKKEELRTPEEKASLEALTDEVAKIRGKIQDYEVGISRLYDQTAEALAQAKTVLWWILFLSYQENEKGEHKDFFGEGTYEQRLAKHDEFHDKEDPFTLRLIRRFAFCISFWYNSKANSQEDFEEVIKAAGEQLDI